MLGFVKTYSEGKNIFTVKSYISYEKSTVKESSHYELIRKESREAMVVAATAPGAMNLVWLQFLIKGGGEMQLSYGPSLQTFGKSIRLFQSSFSFSLSISIRCS